MYISCIVVYYQMYFYGTAKKPERETVWLVYKALQFGDTRKIFQHSLLKVDSAKLNRIFICLLKVSQFYNLYFGKKNCLIYSYPP